MKLIRLLVLSCSVMMVGCSSYENVDLRTINRAEGLCEHHGGLESVAADNYYQYAFDTNANKQYLQAICKDGSVIRKKYTN